MEAAIAEWPNQKIFDALKERGEKVGPILPSTKFLYAKKLAKLMEKEATVDNPSKQQPHKKPLQAHVQKIQNQKVVEDQVENGSSGLIVESPKLIPPKMVSKQIKTPSKVAPKTKVVEVVNDKGEAKKQAYKPLYTSQSFGSPTENLLRSVRARRPLHTAEKVEAKRAERKIQAPICKKPFWSFQKVSLLIGIFAFFLGIYLLMESNPSNLSLV